MDPDRNVKWNERKNLLKMFVMCMNSSWSEESKKMEHGTVFFAITNRFMKSGNICERVIIKQVGYFDE
jgi:hypothetical protein